ncbi:MAG: GlsB/YeaQ/YmgE family stress response membrane protein [Stellaceae bacterium]
MFHWLWVIIIGFLAGAIAKLFVHGPGGFIVTTLLGIVGAIFASWLGQRIGWYAPGQNAGFIGAIVGAVLILAIYRAILGSPG